MANSEREREGGRGKWVSKEFMLSVRLAYDDDEGDFEEYLQDISLWKFENNLFFSSSI